MALRGWKYERGANGYFSAVRIGVSEDILLVKRSVHYRSFWNVQDADLNYLLSTLLPVTRLKHWVAVCAFAARRYILVRCHSARSRAVQAEGSIGRWGHPVRGVERAPYVWPRFRVEF